MLIFRVQGPCPSSTGTIADIANGVDACAFYCPNNAIINVLSFVLPRSFYFRHIVKLRFIPIERPGGITVRAMT